MKKLFITSLLFIACSATKAQVKFTASISPASISTDETAQLTFTVENAQQIEQLEAPELKDFIIVSGPNQQSSMQMINGDVKQSLSLTYIIKPKQKGNFELGPASAKLNGKIMNSNKLSLKVTKGTAAPENKDPKEKNKNNKVPQKKNEINTEENYTFILPSSQLMYLS